MNFVTPIMIHFTDQNKIFTPPMVEGQYNVRANIENQTNYLCLKKSALKNRPSRFTSEVPKVLKNYHF